MRFLGNLFGGQSGARTAVGDLVRALDKRGDGLTDERWAKLIGAKALDEVFDEELPHVRLVKLSSANPYGVNGLIARCVLALEQALADHSGKGEEMEEAPEIIVSNAAFLLSRALAVVHSTPASKVTASIDSGALLAAVWATDSGKGRSLAERVVDVAMRLLFLDGFTVDAPEKNEEADGSRTEAAANGQAVDALRIWNTGVGPEVDEDAAQSSPDDGTRSNRQLGMQLLVCAICGGAPAAAITAVAAAQEQKDKGAEPAKVSLKCFIGDEKFLNYLTDPAKPVPYRAELFYSLLSVSLGYDPSSGGMFSGSGEQEYVHCCLQTLCVLLQSSGDAAMHTPEALTEARPQEALRGESASSAASSPSTGRPHVFRDLLTGVSKEEELSFMASGVGELLDAVGQTSVLPGGSRSIGFLQELLVLIMHLSSLDGFVKAVSREEDACLELVEGVISIMDEEAEDADPDALAFVGGVTLLRLTSHREVAVALNEDFEGSSPDELGKFDGSGADLVSLLCLKRVSDRIPTTFNNSFHNYIVDLYLCVLGNVSIYAEGFCVPTCLKFYSLFDRCSKAAQVRRGVAGVAVFLPRLFEVLSNVVQYQYTHNMDLVYGLLTRRSAIAEMTKLFAELIDEQEKELPSSATFYKQLHAQFAPLRSLVELITPDLEAAIEKKEISSPQQAKELLPKSALGLLPVPHSFVMRFIHNCESMSLCCDVLLVNAVASGPLAGPWEEDGGDDSDDEIADASSRGRGGPDDQRRQRSASRRSASRQKKDEPTRRRSTSRQAAASSGRGSGFEPPARAATATTPSAASSSAPAASQPAPAAASAAPAAAAAPAPAVDPVEAAKAQLAALAASGVDVSALLQQAQGAQAAPAATANGHATL